MISVTFKSPTTIEIITKTRLEPNDISRAFELADALGEIFESPVSLKIGYGTSKGRSISISRKTNN